MNEELITIARQTAAAVTELLTIAALRPGEILVVGCSTSEVRGARIGSDGSEAVAAAILTELYKACVATGIHLAVQCCEHLNRALVIERSVMEQYGFDMVSVVPMPKAGGATAAQAMRIFTDPVVVEIIEAHAGLDIGATLIGMHLKRVAIPVRLTQKRIGQAPVIAARTRPKLIGGARAVYDLPPCHKN